MVKKKSKYPYTQLIPFTFLFIIKCCDVLSSPGGWGVWTFPANLAVCVYLK